MFILSFYPHYTLPSFILLSFKNAKSKTCNKPNSVSRKRKSLTAAQKKEICLKKMSTPFLKQKELANEYDVSEGIIGCRPKS